MEKLKLSSAQRQLRPVQSQAQINGELSSAQGEPDRAQIQSSLARAQFQLQMGVKKFQLKAQHYQLLSLNHNQGNQPMHKVCKFYNTNATAHYKPTEILPNLVLIDHCSSQSPEIMSHHPSKTNLGFIVDVIFAQLLCNQNIFFYAFSQTNLLG